MSSSTYKNSQASWRSGSSTASERYLGATSNATAGNGSTANSLATGLTSSKYATGNASRTSKTDFSASASKQKDTNAPAGTSITNLNATLNTGGTSPLSRFSSSRSSLNGASGSTSGLASIGKNISGSINSVRDSSTPSSQTYREKSNVSSSGTSMTLREKYSNGKNEKNSVLLGSTSTLMASIRDKSGLNAATGSTVRREKSNVSSTTSSISSASMKREKSNASTTSGAKDKIRSSSSSASGATTLNTSFSEKSKQLLASLSSTETSAVSGYRSSSTFLRPTSTSTTAGNQSTSRSTTDNTRASSKLFPLDQGKKTDSLLSTLSSSGSNAGTGNVTGSGGTSNFKIFTTKDIEKPAPIVPVESAKPLGTGNSAAMTSSLRTTARFGLRSGTSHAQYNSSLPCKPVLEDIKPATKNRNQKKGNDGPKSWMTRGTSPDPTFQDPSCTFKRSKYPSAISMEEIPAVSPKFDITIVVKNKECQTEEIREPPKPLSSIPRPSALMFNAFNPVTRFGSKGARGCTPSDGNESPNSSETKLKVTKRNNDAESTEELPGRPGQKKNSLAQKQRQSSSSPHSSPCRKLDNVSPVPQQEKIEKVICTEMNAPEIIGSNAGIVVTLPNKEFRKSALNVGESDCTAEEEFNKTHDEMKRLSMNSQTVKSCAKSIPHPADSPDPFTRRPPTDPTKSPTNPPIAPAGAGSRPENKFSPASGISKLQKGTLINTSALSKMKSGKNLIPIRKNSTSSCSESESSSSMSSSSKSSSSNKRSNPDVKRVASQLIYGESNVSQGRRGSVTSNTSCSSAASSRSSSSERQIPRVNLRPNCPPTASPSKSLEGSGQEAGGPPESGEDPQPKQTSFLLRALASAEERISWVRRCESGEIPWWMAASNKNVPGLLAKNLSSANLIAKSPTTKQMPIYEDDPSAEVALNPHASPSEFENTNMEQEHGEMSELPSSAMLEERTSPDGGEISAEMIDSLFHATLNSEKPRAGKFPAKQPFIGNMTNIDDILGTFCPSPVPPLISPETFNPLQQSTENNSASKSRIKDQEDQDSSNDSSDEDGTGAGESHTENKKKPKTDFDDDDDDSSDDGGSTGTSSSFEEMDPEALIIQSFETLNISIKNNEASSNSSGTMLPPGSIETVQDECTTADNICQPLDQNQPYDETTSARELSDAGLIPQSQREKLDDATLQLYKDGDFGTYLDLEASISEQQDDFEGFFNNRKNSIVLRAQLPVRVHAIIEKLLNSDGRELRRALFSLKQIFQEDKDLVHEFVENGGLSCLIKVGSDADQNYQNYILRAIGQVMLYVDGMYGVMRHNETVQWLYSLVASKFRLVQKTALKLLLVFVDYVESNCLLLVQAVTTVDIIKGCPVWNNVMSLLREHDSGDTELLVYGMTLVNKVLNGITDIETYYDQVDALEEQGMASLIQKCMGKQCADLDLIQQFQIYEVVLKHEDGEEDNIMMHLDENMRQKLLNRKGYGDGGDGLKERRKSRRHSANGTPPSTPTGNGSTLGFLNPHVNSRRLSGTGDHVRRDSVEDWSSSPSSSHSSSPAPQHGNSNESTSPIISNGYAKDKCISNDIDVTPGLRRRRERAERQKSLILEQKQVNGSVKINGFNNSHDSNTDGHTTDDSMGSPVTPCSPVRNPDSISLISLGRSNSIGSKKDSVLSAVSTNGNHVEANNLVVVNGNGANNNNNNSSTANNNKANRPWMLPTHQGGKPGGGPAITGGNPGEKENSMEKEIVESDNIILRRESTVKDLTQKLANQSLITSPVDENKSFSRTGDLSGVVSKAKEGLAKSKSRADIKPPQAPDVVNGTSGTGTNGNSILEAKKSDNELHWDFLVSNLNRPLEVCDLDFTDLKDSDDTDILAPSPHLLNGSVNGLPPPVPTMNGFHLGPPPPPPNRAIPPPPMANGGLNGLISNGKGPPAPPLFGVSLKHPGNNGTLNGGDVILTKSSKKTKKTVKLFWKEVREDPVTAMKIQKVGCLWDELAPIPIDTQRLEHLFESRAKDVITKKQTDLNKSKEIVVLDPKRSNAINIGMTKLPPPRTIKAAIMKMDATIINREGIEKLLTMLPTEEERAKIQEAQFANPEIPLGSAEQFLLTLASISELSARLKLWAFKLDYENLEKEVAEPLMDLKQGMEALEKNKTFRCILTTLLCIGNFLNGAEAKGFQIEYLSKVPEVKDTVHKHSLLHHLCHIVIEKFPESTDLYSEIGPVTRASRVDFDEVATNLGKMETDCKSSWDHLRVIAKHDGPTNMKLKMSEFLADCAERIIVLGIVHRRVTNRYHKFLLWLGVLAHQVTTTKPHVLFKVISEFALEYRTTRERVIQQLQKKANHRERNKTRGKMITEQLVCKNTEDKADAELRQVLTTNGDTSEGEVVRGAMTWQRRTKTTTTSNIIYNNNKTATLNGHGTVPDGDDEILESLVKTATSTPATRAAPRERKRNSRCLDRKSLRRTLRHGLSEEERKLLAAFMANGHSF